ncbi:PAX-interacting protein 1-like [Hyalella azteca]|uniref:PAX-interacting protein 1-like n=1 Tax=Hyalella azteca TaxID=294128 RepID=A0A8B7NVG7_HYAAZ|nr:PAX-interacting protein 1-like [Hyalella azteca]
MEIDVKLSDLQVVPNMFKDVKYYATGTISKEVETLLSNGGAQLESHITDLMTHLIVGSDPDEIEMGEVKEIYEKPVVLQSWVVLSAKCNTLLPKEPCHSTQEKKVNNHQTWHWSNMGSASPV